MHRSAFAAVLSAALVSLSSAAMAIPLRKVPMRFVTADGAWDCKDEAGTNLGTIVIADKTYAFIRPDGSPGGYGRLHRVGEADYDLPHFIVLDGYAKDELGVAGTTMRGPVGDTENFAAGIYFVLILANQDELECVRREAAEV